VYDSVPGSSLRPKHKLRFSHSRNRFERNVAPETSCRNYLLPDQLSSEPDRWVAELRLAWRFSSISAAHKRRIESGNWMSWNRTAAASFRLRKRRVRRACRVRPIRPCWDRATSHAQLDGCAENPLRPEVSQTPATWCGTPEGPCYRDRKARLNRHKEPA